MAVDRPVCFWCAWQHRPRKDRFVSPADAVFEALCGHVTCPTYVFHGLCLMEFREDPSFADARRANNALIARLQRGDDGEG